MNVRDAILKTAELFEREPELFQFNNPWVPDCGTPGCALGHIGAFLGMDPDALVPHVADRLDISELTFYFSLSEFDISWHNSAERCARALRAYAEKHCPEPAGIPQTVRRIFEPETAVTE